MRYFTLICIIDLKLHCDHLRLLKHIQSLWPHNFVSVLPHKSSLLHTSAITVPLWHLSLLFSPMAGTLSYSHQLRPQPLNQKSGFALVNLSVDNWVRLSNITRVCCNLNDELWTVRASCPFQIASFSNWDPLAIQRDILTICPFGESSCPSVHPRLSS